MLLFIQCGNSFPLVETQVACSAWFGCSSPDNSWCSPTDGDPSPVEIRTNPGQTCHKQSLWPGNVQCCEHHCADGQQSQFESGFSTELAMISTFAREAPELFRWLSRSAFLTGFASHSYWLSLTMMESLKMSDHFTEHWQPFLSFL